jgi:hypothetical protein
MEFQASMSMLKEQKALNDYRKALSGGYNRPGQPNNKAGADPGKGAGKGPNGG